MSGLTHFDDSGASRMVDVSDKPETARSATASGLVRMRPETRAMIEGVLFVADHAGEFLPLYQVWLRWSLGCG